LTSATFNKKLKIFDLGARDVQRKKKTNFDKIFGSLFKFT